MKMELNKIIHADSIKYLLKLPDKSVDLVFADPPYNLQLKKELHRSYDGPKFDAVTDEWDKFESFKHYDAFCFIWLRECKRILKDNGTICVMGSYHNIHRIGRLLQDHEYWLLNDIIWIKANPTPNFMGTRFNNAHETLIWASKTKDSKFTFNYQTMKQYNGNKQMRSDWYIPIVNGKARLKDEEGNKAHPTQKPGEILKRIILATTNKGDIILDPFMGSGTTGVIAKMLERNYIGIEKELKYVELAMKRINKIKVGVDERAPSSLLSVTTDN